MVLIKQLHPHVAVARHTIKVFNSKKCLHPATLFGHTAEAWLCHELKVSLVGAHLRHATCIVGQFHLNDGGLFHSE